MADIYLAISETPTVVTLTSAVLTSAVASSVTVANVVSVNVVTMPSISIQAPSVTTVIGTVTIGNFPASQAVTFSAVTISNFPSTQTIAGTVNVGNVIAGIQDGDGNTFGIDRTFPVTVNSLPSLPTGSNLIGQVQINGQINSNILAGTARIGVVTIGGGTVTIGAGTAQIGSVTASISGTVPVSLASVPVHAVTLTSTTVTVSSLPALAAGTAQIGSVTASISNAVTVGNSITIGSLPAISGAVTVNQLPRVTLIDNSGSITVANSAVTVFASSTTRSYLLVQVTTGSVFLNVGATATTLNGISLTAGQGYAWETTIPQGIVSLISTTTSSLYVAKQA